MNEPQAARHPCTGESNTKYVSSTMLQADESAGPVDCGVAKQAAGAEMLSWLRGKVADAERALKTREDMAATWRGGTDAEWRAAGKLHPSTTGLALGKAARLKAAAGHDRIAGKLRRELAMFRAVLATLTQAINPNS